ncbi:MAG: hypothetical protein LBB80_03080 [Treponema sp.]|jgi:hypothetical protein|nr:hypothetical protein [Treponema sp.]
MTSRKNFVPPADGAFLEWVKNLLAYTAAHATAWNIPPEEITELQTLLTIFEEAYEKVQNPNRGKADTGAKNDARHALEQQVRWFINARIRYNPKVSPEDLDHMNLPRHDATPTPHPRPTTYPEYEVRIKGFRLLEVAFWDAGVRSKGKPAGIQGAKLCWGVFDEAPKNPEALPHSVFATRSPYILEFQEEDRGKRVWFSLCWENSKREQGPWGLMMQALIP